MTGSTSPVRLYYMPRTRSSRVLWLLEEIGEPYDLTEIAGAQRRSAEHLRRHPLGRVPALELGDGTTIFESAAICLQLADLNLMPDSSRLWDRRTGTCLPMGRVCYGRARSTAVSLDPRTR